MTHPEPAFPDDAFSRLDELPDPAFYEIDRMVSHLDDTALATVRGLIGRLVTERSPRILDLMASWDSHLPDELEGATVVGLGLNRRELAANRRLASRVVHDLNADPSLPFETDSFDAALCTVSVDYLTRPFEVFHEVSRVLRPGGLFLVVFSSRFFPEKVVKIWREASERERVRLVREYFGRSDGFKEPREFMDKGKPRPEGDRYAILGLPSDPIYAVFSEAAGSPGPTRELDGADSSTAADSEAFRARRAAVGSTLECPHCSRRLSKWRVPQTPFVEWSSTYQFICFNDGCPFYVGGWNAFADQGIPGSYRFMYDPDSNGCHTVPVLTPSSLRASIVATEDRG